MAKYTKPNLVSGGWVKASELKSGSRAKIVTEAQPVQSQFKNEKTGELKTQDVCKVRFENVPDPMNVNLNRATITALIDAFGDDSKAWINQVLTVHTEKVVVGGKRVTALYLVPADFEVVENDEGYIEIVKKGGYPPMNEKNDASGFDSAVDTAFESPEKETVIE
jgi:hypothetical protein